jgi:hypothetical protein
MPRRIRTLIRIARIGLTAAAISQELRKPEAERTWQGLVAGFVPYYFRPPTFKRIRDSYWNPEDERLFLPRPWGVGWAVNLFQARLVLTRLFEGLMGGRRPTLLVGGRERSA